MKTQIRYPFVFAVLCFWLGLMLSISFLETPLKFQVPGMTLPVALALGKLIFGVSTNIQLFLTGVIALNFLLVKKYLTAGIIISYILLVILLLLEKFWMLPVLDARADMLAGGKSVQPTSLHDYFIYAEVGKLILIVGGIFLQLKKIKK
ncbi:hypothetical protein OZ666_01815 [Elizabethkingia sp. HX QKY]|uniref:hypothetical protein n=1 Tax=Elizabethkingia TaxID=308865 RepID=UPI002A242DE2|nr:hypothetical protein [Elizabethkingia sp. HX QKY]MDX8570400.1 hypothetical protein [Elizabethkingia sp. HX QKY]